MKNKILIKFIVLLWIVWILSLLSACSKTNPVSAVADNIKNDITIIESQIQDVKDNLTAECKTPYIDKNLEIIQTNVKNIKSKVDVQVSICDTQNKVLTEENSKLKWIIFSLLTIGCLLGYLLTIKHKILLTK